MEIGSLGRSESYPAELEFCVFEIDDQTHLKPGGPQIIEHAANFVIRNPINGFRINDDFAENNEIGNVFPDFDFTIVNGKPALLGKWNSLKTEFNR